MSKKNRNSGSIPEFTYVGSATYDFDMSGHGPVTMVLIHYNYHNIMATLNSDIFVTS